MITIDKVNEFEHGVDSNHHNQVNTDYISFSVESNIHYRYSSAKDLLDNPKDLAAMIKHHYEKQVPRLSVLDDYYKAKNTNIMQNTRRKEKGKADHRSAHNFGKIITQFDVGYNTGNPIKVEIKDETKQNAIDEFDLINDIEGLNSELWLDMDKYGRAYELHYRSQADEDRVSLSNVFETFVVYDTTIERLPIMGVRYFNAGFNNDNEGKEFKVIGYTDDKIIRFNNIKMDTIELIQNDEKKHSHKEVQIIEHSSNRFRQGIYEDVLSLIDLYDSAQSDTANYMTDLNDALLVISGDIESGKFSADDILKMKDANMLLLESGVDALGNKTSVNAGYIYKQYDVNGSEAYKERVQSDIHKISNVPNLADENFGGNQSGESMKYKLFGFEQMTATKQRLFKKGLMSRYRLLFNLKSGIKELNNSDLKGIQVKFTPNLPKAIANELEMLTQAGAELSQETLLGLASFITSAKDEIERVEKENEAPSLYDGDVIPSKTNEGE